MVNRANATFAGAIAAITQMVSSGELTFEQGSDLTERFANNVRDLYEGKTIEVEGQQRTLDDLNRGMDVINVLFDRSDAHMKTLPASAPAIETVQ
jgi:polyhydroxyalkanoate synthesis regulator phasin